MPFDILGYQKENKDFYGDAPLEDVAKDAYSRGGYAEKYPDYNSWKQVKGIDSVIQEDTKKRTPKTWEDKLSDAVASVTPKGFEDITTSFVKGATLGYVPAAKTPEDAGIIHKMATGAAGLAGMGVGLIPAAALLPEAATVAGVAATGAALGGIYGAVRKPEEGESRLSNTWKDALMFGAFGAGGKVITKGLGAVMPETVGKLLEKIDANAKLPAAERVALTPVEEAIHSKLGYVTSGALMGGAGATEPAEDWKQRVQNIVTGIGVGVGAHGITSAFHTAKGVVTKETKIDPETEDYLNKVKLGADSAAIIDEGLKTGKVGEEQFTPDHAIDIIKTGQKVGVFNDEDIDRFRDKYPALKQGLNGITVDSAINKVNEALKIIQPISEDGQKLNKIIPMRNIETDVPLNLGEPVDEIAPKEVVSKEISAQDETLAKGKANVTTEDNKSLAGTPEASAEVNKALLPPDLKSDNVFARMPEEVLRPLAEQKVQGAVDEFARRSGTTPEINPLASAKAKLEGQPNAKAEEIVQLGATSGEVKPWEGKAYRGETNRLGKGTESAADVIRYERDELGNTTETDHLTPDMLKHLEDRPSSDLVWVTKDPKDAARYLLEDMEGKVTKKEIDAVDEHIIPKSSVVLAEDGDGGSLILKGGFNPDLAKQKEGKAKMSPEPVMSPKIQGTEEIKGTVEPAEIFIRAAGKKDIGASTKSMSAIPDKEGYEKVYKPYGKEGRGFYYVKSEAAKTPLPEVKKTNPNKGAQNLVTFLQKAGKVRLGPSFTSNTTSAWERAHGKKGKDVSREYGVISEVSSKNGKMSMDEAASYLNAEGFVARDGKPWTDVSLFEELSTGDPRNILHPEKAESIINRQIERQPNEWADEQARLAEEKIDPSAITESQADIIAGASETPGAERLTPEVLEANAKEVDNFFDEMSKAKEPRTENTEAGKQVTIPGASAAETFSLNNPETEISKPLSEQATPKNADMFAEKKTAEIKAKAGVTKDETVKRAKPGEETPYVLEEGTANAPPTHLSKPITDKESVEKVATIISGTIGRNIAPENLRLYERTGMDDLGKLGRVFQKKVMVFQVKGENLPELPGFFSPKDSSSIYLNATAPDPHLTILGHELLHALKHDTPDIYKDFISHVQATEQMLKSAEIYQKGYGGKASNSLLVEEYVAEYMGKRFTQKSFWDDLAKQKPNIFEKIYDVFTKLIDKIKGIDFSSDMFFRDIKKAEQLSSKAMADYAERMKDKGGVINKANEGKVEKLFDSVEEKGVEYNHEIQGAKRKDIVAENQVAEGQGKVPDTGRANLSYPEVVSEKTGTYRAAKSKITNSDDLAQLASANIGNKPQENFISVVTGKNGKILSVYRHTIGVKDQSQIDVPTVIGNALHNPAAVKIWIAHNHPSGNHKLSPDDIKARSEMENLLRGTRISLGDAIAVGRGRYGSEEGGGVIPEAESTKKLTVSERVFSQRGDQKEVNSADDLTAFAKENKIEGIILLDKSNKPVGTIDGEDFSKVRGEKQEQLLKEIEKRNATGMAIVRLDKFIPNGEIENLRKFAAATRLNFLDGIDKNGSVQARGLALKTNDKEFYSVNKAEAGQTHQMPTLDDVKSVFKGQVVKQDSSGKIWIKTSGDKYLNIIKVDHIEPDETVFNIGYSRSIKQTEKIAGAYLSAGNEGQIRLVRDTAGKQTLHHESIHFMEDFGIINSNEVGLLQRHIKNLVTEGKFETQNAKDIGGAEDRANFLADAMTKDPQKLGLLGRITTKIQEFVDKLVNAFGIRTVKGIERDVKTGDIYNKEKYGQSATDSENRRGEWDGVVPSILQEQGRGVGNKGQGTLAQGNGEQYSLSAVGKSIDALKEKLNKFTDKADAVKNAKDGFGLAYDGMKRAFYPSARTEAANKAAETIIGQMGKNFHQQALLKGKLNEVVNHYRESTSVAAKTLDLMQTSTGILADGIFNKMPKEKQWDFISRIQNFKKQETPELQGIADTLSKMYDDLYRDSESVTPGAVKYRKGYFPGMWEDEAAAQKFFSDRAKSMEGSKAFTKEKVFDDINAGIEAGLKPKGTPIDMAFAKMHEVQKYVTTHRVLQEMEADKTAILVKSGEREPPGYKFVPEPYGVVTRKEKVNLAGKQQDLSKELPGTPKMESYRYAVKDDVAQIFQNYLSRSLYDNKYVGKVYEGYMNAANTLNQFQLGVGSAFHAGFTSMEAVISKFALGVKAMARGDVGEAVKLMAASPLQVYKNPALGDKLLRAYRGESVTGQEIPQLVKWLEMAGGRATMDSRFRTSSTDKMIEAWTKGNKVSAVVRSPFAMVEQMARPILEWLVPRQKFGVFAEMATEWNKQNPNATHEETRSAMQYVWNRVDSRLGQVVYERLFTQNVAKNIVQGLVRAPGWTGGTIIEIGGGVNDFVKVFNDIVHGRKPQMTDKMAYTISLLTITGLINGVMTTLMTGEPPKDGMDLLSFRTGKIDERGNPERFLLPTYAKDIYAYINKPGTTLLNKTHPMLSLMADIAKNKDYYGVAVRDKEANLAVQAGQTGLYAVKAFVPFWMRGTQKAKERGDDLASMLSPLIGVMPATAEFTKTNAQKLMSEILQARPKGTTTKAQFETNQLKNKLETRLRNHDPEASGDIQQYLKDGKLSRKDVISIQKAVKTPYLVNAFKPLSLKEAMRVYSVATPEEKKIFLPLLRKKTHLLRDLPEEERQDTLIKFRQVIGE